MFKVVLFQPEIPPNTGNIIRLCANTGCELHLIKPLGFPLEDAKLRRAGLDYHEYAHLQVHENWQSCLQQWPQQRIFMFTTQGKHAHHRIAYQLGDAFLFGRETAGLPAEVHALFPPQQRIRLPMRPNNRSLNLANAVAITVYEAWRQHHFVGSV